MSTTNNEDTGSDWDSEKAGRTDSQSRARDDSLREWKDLELKQRKQAVVQVDIKTCKHRQWAASRKALSDLTDPVASFPSEPSASLPKLSTDTPQCVSSRHFRRLTDLAGTPTDSVFLLENVSSRPDGHKVNTSTYKLTRKRKSTEIEPVAVPGEDERKPVPGFSAQTLIKIVKDSVDEVPLRKKSAVKHLRTGSGGILAPLCLTARNRQSQDDPLKVPYFIKTRKDSANEFTSLLRSGPRRDERKSRAERLWAWKGKRGALGPASIGTPQLSM